MDKAAIKTFAIESRRKLMEDVEYRMSLLGITKDGIKDSISDVDGVEAYDYGASTPHKIYDKDIQKRAQLVKEVQNKGFENVIEEVAYTWFNRIIAIRFMEVNNYLPTRTRVLSSETPGKTEPDIITEALNLDLDYTQDDRELIFKLKDENKLDELFRFLFIKQCNKLNEILPGLFEKTEDYIELLLSISFTSENGVVRQLIDTISEEDFGEQVEIIGWLYQFYNTELKDESYANLKNKKLKFSKESIPSVSQIFTPDWIVKYMVENSVGKLWIMGHKNNDLKENWDYYLDDLEQEEDVKLKLNDLTKYYKNIHVNDIKVIDPCMGSGHILVYVFDVLMQIYVSEGYTEKDATISILENNLYGLDIDDRAYQLAYFAVMMKARSYSRKILNLQIKPHLLAIQESNSINHSFIDLLSVDYPNIKMDLTNLINKFQDAKLYGSLLDLENIDFEIIDTVMSDINTSMSSDFRYLMYYDDINLLNNLINQSKILSVKYDVAITNPPYIKKGNLDKKIVSFLNDNFPNYKMDFLTAFMDKCFSLIKTNGFSVLVTTSSWMFSGVYKSVREDILYNKSLLNLLYLGPQVLGIGFESVVSICRNIRLSDFKGNYKRIFMEDIKNDIPINFSNCETYYINSSKFLNIPSLSFAFWADESFINSFKLGKPLGSFSDLKVGLQTGLNDRFLRYWFEVNYNDIGFNFTSCDESKNSNLKWFPYNKGGKYRKWYGNQDYVINWENDGYEVRNFNKSVLRNSNFYFNESISWSKVSKGNISFRYYPKGFIFDSIGCSLFLNQEYINYILALLNSKISQEILNIISPTLGSQVGDFALIPIIFSDFNKDINNIVLENISISKEDFDDYETSWNFTSHPFIKYSNNNLKNIFELWFNDKSFRFNKLKNNEILLNQIFSRIYNVNVDENIEDNHVSINKSDYEKDVKSFISYAVGCMFGRYSLDKEGLQFAGGEFNLNNYSKFTPDDDNIIPVLDTEYFEDDIIGYFVEFVKKSFSEETLEENLDFIGNALSKSNKTSREKIREYLLKNFFKDHTQIYQKRPIYWMFSSGKQNGFNCLVYMHRYTPDLVARVRTDYLHKTQKAIEQNIVRCDNIINNSSVASEKTKATKEKNKLEKQLQETREYDEALAHIANQNIEIDLDDGVKVNYEKFQGVEVSKEGQKTKKVNLLKKI